MLPQLNGHDMNQISIPICFDRINVCAKEHITTCTVSKSLPSFTMNQMNL